MAKSGPQPPVPNPAAARPILTGAVDTSRSRHWKMNEKAVGLLESGQTEQAKKIFMEVLEENEDDVFALHGMALVARNMGRLNVALELMTTVMEREPRNPMVASNLGTIQEAKQDFEGALKSYRNALKWGAEGGIIHNNIGSVLSKMQRRTEALIAFRKALSLGVEIAETYTNIATMLADLGEHKQADEYFRKSLEMAPEDEHAHHNLGIIMLLNGNFEEGWEHYEWRMKATNRGVPWRRFPQPLWNGNVFHGARLMLYAEQGIGDEIRFASMIPEAIARGGEVVVECAPRLVSLFQRSFPQVRVVPSKYAPAEEGIEPFDIQCPFGTMGRLFRGHIDKFPVHEGYLTPDPRRVAEYAERLRQAGPGPYVGLCWRSGVKGAYRTEYYSEIADMRPILKVEGVTFVNLQYDVNEEELQAAREMFGVDLVAWDDLDLKNDLDGAAALTKCMDLVISPATSVGVMSGAVNVETIEFRPFPLQERYFKNGRCPWFPSKRIFMKRQSEKWNKLLRKIAREVELLRDGS